MENKYNLIFQYETLPNPTIENLNSIYQYTGVTTEDYTNGHFYKVVTESVLEGYTGYKYEEVSQKAPEYTIVKDSTAAEGAAATYHLQRNGENVGAAINIPKDFFLSNASFGFATAEDIAEGGKLYGKDFVVGDTYLELDVNVIDGTTTTVKEIFCKMNDLVDIYVGKNGIIIDAEKNEISIDLADISGLNFVGDNSDKLAVKSGNGIEVTADGIKVKKDTAGPIVVNANGVNIDLADGLVVNTNKKVEINNDTSLKIDADSKKIGIDFETVNIDFANDWD